MRASRGTAKPNKPFVNFHANASPIGRKKTESKSAVALKFYVRDIIVIFMNLLCETERNKMKKKSHQGKNLRGKV